MRHFTSVVADKVHHLLQPIDWSNAATNDLVISYLDDMVSIYLGPVLTAVTLALNNDQI